MKKLFSLSFILSYLPALAVDPSGSHYTDFDSDSSSGLPAPILLALLLIVSIICIWMGNKDKDSKGMRVLGYIGLAGFVLLSLHICSE